MNTRATIGGRAGFGLATLAGVAGMTAAAGLIAPGCRRAEPAPRWVLSPESAVKTDDPILMQKIGRALDAAEKAGTLPLHAASRRRC